MKITFLGGVEEVTGSRYFIEHEDARILVDCGLFQGNRDTRKRNWDAFPIEPRSIDVLVITHAHIDHTGYIPRLTKDGFKGSIYCSPATYALCSILLMDNGVLQERRADKLKKPPLYTVADAQNALKFFQTIDYNSALKIKSLTITLTPSHHILGASFVMVSDGKRTLTFSGDLGRPHQFIMKAPAHLTQTDFLVIESTYGDRLHTEGDPIEVLGQLINETVAKGGKIIIPAFAVARTQTLLYCLYQLKQKKVIPDIPIFLDSPMAIAVTNLYCQFNDEHTLSPSACSEVFGIATPTRTEKESKRIDQVKGSAIIVAGSGMADGGRVVTHFKRYISKAKNTIIFVGFQAEGSEGRALVEGAQEIEIDGKVYTVQATIKTINMFSAHADYNEILDWLTYFKTAPQKVFVTHGELEAARSLKKKIEERFGWSVVVPKYEESFDLD